jgi:hypothetical protein
MLLKFWYVADRRVGGLYLYFFGRRSFWCCVVGFVFFRSAVWSFWFPCSRRFGRFGGLYFFRSSVCIRRFGRFGFCVVSGSVVSACIFFLLAVCIFFGRRLVVSVVCSIFRSVLCGRLCIFSVGGLVVLVPVWSAVRSFRRFVFFSVIGL